MKITLRNQKVPRFKIDRLYPDCPRSKDLITLLWDDRQKRCRLTFSDEEVRILRKVGFDIEIIGDPYDK